MTLLRSAEQKPFIYNNVEVTNIVDGNTIDLSVDLGFGVWHRNRFHLDDVVTPNRGDPQFEPAKKYLEALLEDTYSRKGMKVQAIRRDMYGRWFVKLTCHATGKCLNKKMIDSGHATPRKTNSEES
jgi:endonuclease YncB( thermonuclease family)